MLLRVAAASRAPSDVRTVDDLTSNSLFMMLANLTASLEAYARLIKLLS
jgi:hypothetical protein